MCFVADLLQLVVVSSMVSFFMGFLIDNSYDKVRSNKVINILHIWNLTYLRCFFMIKSVGFELIIFAINLDATSFYKLFSTFDYVFLSIILLT